MIKSKSLFVLLVAAGLVACGDKGKAEVDPSVVAGEKLFQDLVPDFLTCHPLEKYALKKPFQASWVQKSYLSLSSTRSAYNNWCE